MNKAILIGNLTRDPESRTTASGISMCTFTVAVNRRFTNQQGQREADFINVVAWRQNADFVSRYLTKGSKCSVVGSIQTRTYDAQDGSKRYVTEVVADEVESIRTGGSSERRPQDDVPPPPEPTGYSPKETTAAPAAGFGDLGDDELPF